MNSISINYPEVIRVAWYVAVGMLAAFGAFCALWTILGWLFPGGNGCVIVCVGEPDEQIIVKSKWLRDMGFPGVPMIVLTDEPGREYPGMENCSWEELLPRLEWERNRFDGTGNGDYSGRDQCRGISEL